MTVRAALSMSTASSTVPTLGAGPAPSAGAVAGDRRAVFKKRHRQFCCVLIDHTNGRVLDVLESREKNVVVQWLNAAKESGLLSSVQEVTSDMWDAYVEAAKERIELPEDVDHPGGWEGQSVAVRLAAGTHGGLDLVGLLHWMSLVWLAEGGQ